MKTQAVTPILNVSDIHESFAWFEKLGWQKGWEWGDPTGFGGVCSGEVEIFLCQNGQGGRGRGSNKTTFGTNDAETADKGVWLSLWVADVDAVYEACQQQGIEVTWPPEICRGMCAKCTSGTRTVMCFESGNHSILNRHR